jgi:competence protein ComEA
VIVVAALATAGIVFFGPGSVPGPPAPPSAVAAVVTAGTDLVTVHVSGAVADPGLVGVGESSRVADAIAAAGGTTSGADLQAINLAAPVRDGDRVVVPVSGDSEDGLAAASVEDARVRINIATPVEIETLPGVGPVLAGRIVEYRETHGLFSEVEDLLDVPGIGEAKLATLRESVTVP